MPKKLPQPMSTASTRCTSKQPARRRRQRETPERCSEVAARHNTYETFPPIHNDRDTHQKSHKCARLSLLLFDSSDGLQTFLPCPSFVGPFSFSSAFKRISRGLKPFVRLPLLDELEESSDQADATTETSSTVETDFSDADCSPTSSCNSPIATLTTLSPAPWTPLKVHEVQEQPTRSSMLISASSTATHHMSMFDMYASGKLVSRYPSLPPETAHEEVESRRSRPKRQSTLRISVSDFALTTSLSQWSFDSARTYVTARTRPISPLSSPCQRPAYPSRSQSSRSLAHDCAWAEAVRSSSATTATAALRAVLKRYSAPARLNAVEIAEVRHEPPKLIMPDPLRTRSETICTMTTVSTVDLISPLDDTKAVRYRNRLSIERRFSNGYWRWDRTKEEPVVGVSPVLEEEESKEWTWKRLLPMTLWWWICPYSVSLDLSR